MGYDGVDSDGVLLWISDGVNLISWTLVGLWLDFGFHMVGLWILDSNWLVWWWCGDGVVVVTVVGG